MRMKTLLALAIFPISAYAMADELPPNFHPQNEIRQFCGELGSLGYETVTRLLKARPNPQDIEKIHTDLSEKYDNFPSETVLGVMMLALDKNLPAPLSFAIYLRDSCLEELDNSAES